MVILVNLLPNEQITGIIDKRYALGIPFTYSFSFRYALYDSLANGGMYTVGAKLDLIKILCKK